MSAAPTTFTIGRLARAIGVQTSTVRYYERCGLLRPDRRSAGNYRLYDAAALERLRFIRAAQANGFALKDISVLLEFRDEPHPRCKKVQALIKARLADLRKRLAQMREVESMLRASLKLCRRFERTGQCRVVDDLKHASSLPLRRRSRR